VQAFNGILDRLKQAMGVSTDTALAKALGIKQGSISGAKMKGSIPARWIIGTAEATGVHADWLLTGKGPMRPEVEESISSDDVAFISDLEPQERTRIIRVTARPLLKLNTHAKPTRIDLELLQASIEAVEEVLEATDRAMSVDKKAELIAAIYDLYEDAEKSIDKSRVLRLVKSAL
jgi:hypothetical protein